MLSISPQILTIDTPYFSRQGMIWGVFVILNPNSYSASVTLVM